MRFTISNVTVELEGITDEQYGNIRGFLDNQLAKQPKARNAVSSTFLYAIRLCPHANPSDIWHHVIYRRFIETHKHGNPGQSWVRVSGEALETAFAEYYNPILSPDRLRIRLLISREEKAEALAIMGLEEVVGMAKLDTALEGRRDGQWQIFGGAHIKASLAERVSDDVPTSQRMMEKGYLSPLLTLDVKSFPPPKDSVNRGELGSPDKPSEKRIYIEVHGSFDNCYSYNLRSVPSKGTPSSGKRIYTLRMSGQRDQLVEDLQAAWTRFSTK